MNHNVCSFAKLRFTASRIVVVSSRSNILIQTVEDPLIELLVILRLFIRWGLATLSRAINCYSGIGHFLVGFDARG